MIRDHIAANLGIEPDDFEYAPFSQQDGLAEVCLRRVNRGRQVQLFGYGLNALIDELLACAGTAGRNESLAA